MPNPSVLIWGDLIECGDQHSFGSNFDRGCIGVLSGNRVPGHSAANGDTQVLLKVSKNIRVDRPTLWDGRGRLAYVSNPLSLSLSATGTCPGGRSQNFF